MAKQKTSTKTSAKKPATPRKKAAAKATKSTKTTAKAGAKPAPEAGDQEVTVDRRRKARRNPEAAEAPASSEPKLQRRKKVNRRRQIDPTTCERDYSGAEVEFMNALDDYKRKSGRMFPTCSEVLEVIRALGYVQLSPAEIAARGGDDLEAAAEAEAQEALAESAELQAETADA